MFEETGEEGIKSSSTILSSSSMSVSRCNSVVVVIRCEAVVPFQFTKLDARVRAIGVLHAFLNPLDGPPREVELEPLKSACASCACRKFTTFVLDKADVSAGKRGNRPVELQYHLLPGLYDFLRGKIQGRQQRKT